MDSARQRGSDERRVEEARVIGRQDHRSRARNAFRIIDAPAKIQPEEYSQEQPRRAIADFHCAASSRFLICSMISALVSSGLISELLMTIAPSEIMSGAAARWLSR